jgi:3-oxoacyl-[acyl-carrier-protein] synthase-3
MAYLRAFGACLPERRVSNAEIAPQLGVTPEWIAEASGIEERRYAASDETVSTLGLAAARNCLEKAGAQASELGMILVASGSSERFCPGPASQIAAALGLDKTPALDIPVASCGSLVGLALASQLAASVGRVLVIGTEIMSRRTSLNPECKDTAILFGDGAGACLVDNESGFARIADCSWFTDGASAGILRVEDNLLHMDGRSVILQASRKLPRAIGDLLSRNSLAPEAVGAYLLHQANLNLITRVAAAVKAPRERFFTNIERYGNTSSASLLIAASEWRDANDGPLTAPILFAAFGTGLNWGALLAAG